MRVKSFLNFAQKLFYEELQNKLLYRVFEFIEIIESKLNISKSTIILSENDFLIYKIIQEKSKLIFDIRGNLKNQLILSKPRFF